MTVSSKLKLWDKTKFNTMERGNDMFALARRQKSFWVCNDLRESFVFVTFVDCALAESPVR
jgi:hypothetical protein